MSRPSSAPYAVVVSSCDAYADLWPYFFHFLFTYWPGIPQPVYLISRQKRFADPRVETLALGHDRHWASNTLEALAKIPHDSILYFQDDYFLTAPANPAAIDRLHAIHLENGAIATSLFNREAAGRPAGDHGLVEMDPKNEWVFDFQAAFWNKAKLTPMIEPGWTPWHAEGTMNDHARTLPGGFYSVTVGSAPVLPYIQVIRGSLWLPEGRQLCREHGLTPDFRFRPCARFQAGFFNRFYRSFLKRRSRAYRKRHPAPADEVQPLAI